mmetsp:Transcript_4467/g.10474  ORF Transcript_4467/g.10474 Transcript_4467/m.10474 type:complete len:341 (-) Transcript_4467:39-1061(-)|eukprot:CAMPEP_0171072006 /NCGR_PEP_ID=MMETSP0766_2-20121228/10620_1 /TAXON_ID=439317 /ORGANISM="Gambierdiscus australes, Strain CAWD 149" /LENGTH=340 /DNA_ID=CAMNT_0011528565 /DNA_START=99 /DNA_END=1121 /DNA_ORIENTATION=-
MGEQFKWKPSGERMGQMMRQAVYVEDMVTLQHLVKQRADLEARDETGATALHIAATQCKIATLSWLIAQKADIRATDGEGFSALIWACLKGHREVVTKLIAGQADVEEVATSNGKTPLTLSAERGHFACVEELLTRKAHLEQPNSDGSTPLMCAAHHNEAEIVAHLLAKNSPVGSQDAEGWSALMYAVNAPLPPQGSGGELTEKKVAIDGVLGKRTTTELLLLHKSDVNLQSKDGLSALIVAATRDRPQAVRQLLECGAQVNMTSLRGQTPLLMAAAHDLPEVVRALIIAQADVNAINAKNDSPLSLSEKNGFKEVIDLLKKAGAVAPKTGKKGKGKKKK